MDPKLKALKVVDLKQILATAKVSVPAKATKSDLIAKILSSNPALEAYAVLYQPDDLLAPPEEVDWNAEQPEVVADPPPAPVLSPPSTKPTTAPVKAAPVASTTKETPTTVTSTEDPELEKRKRRAERFGIPVVEAKQKNATQPPPQKSASGVSAQLLEARAKRFGTDNPKSNGKKRPVQSEDTDPEESERRKKRSERFGYPVKT